MALVKLWSPSWPIPCLKKETSQKCLLCMTIIMLSVFLSSQSQRWSPCSVLFVLRSPGCTAVASLQARGSFVRSESCVCVCVCVRGRERARACVRPFKLLIWFTDFHANLYDDCPFVVHPRAKLS